MAKDSLTPEALAQIGTAMFGPQQGMRPFSIGLPGTGRPESATSAIPPDAIVYASSDEEQLAAFIAGAKAQARANPPPPKAEEPVVEEKREKTARELLKEANEAGERARATFEAICRKRGIDPNAPPAPPPSPVDDRRTMLDRAVAAERDRVEQKAARKEQKQREKLGQRLDKLVGKGAFSK